MKILDSLQHTFHAIFELYKTSGRRYYGFSMGFAIASVLVSIIMSLIVITVYTAITSQGVIFDFNKQVFYFNYLYNYGSDIMVFNFSLYGIFLYRNSTSGERPSFSAFFSAIDARTWGIYLLLVIASLVCSLGIEYFLNPPSTGAYGGRGADYSYSSPFATYIRAVINLLKQFIPFILAFFLIRNSLRELADFRNKSSLRAIFFTLLILGFALNLFSSQAVNIVQTLFTSLLVIPFEEFWIPMVLSLVVYIFLIAVFYPGIAGALVFPFTVKAYENEQPIPRQDNDLTDQSL